MKRLLSVVAWLCLLSLSASACTTWISMPDSNELGTVIIHKTRDFGNGSELSVKMKITEPGHGKFRCIDICEYMYFNEKGLAVLNNAMSGATDTDGNKPLKTTAFMRSIAEACGTLPEVLEFISKMQKENYLTPINLVITDGKQAAMIELTSRHFTVHNCTDGFMVHANHYVSHELEDFHVKQEGRKIENSIKRLELTQEMLQQTLQNNGKMRMEDCLAISRFHDNEKYPDQAPYRYKTVCAADYIVDADYPTLLSTILVQPGPTCCTLAIPVPLCCKSMPPALSDGELGRLSYQLRARGGADHLFRDNLRIQELLFWKEYRDNIASAKKLIADGKQTEAMTLLQNMLEKQTAQAVAKLKAVIEKLPEPKTDKKAEQPEKLPVATEKPAA